MTGNIIFRSFCRPSDKPRLVKDTPTPPAFGEVGSAPAPDHIDASMLRTRIAALETTQAKMDEALTKARADLARMESAFAGTVTGHLYGFLFLAAWLILVTLHATFGGR